MWLRSLALLAIFALLQGAPAPVVETPLGKISGWESDWPTRSGRSYLLWTKVPYAQPPVGSLRFKSPKPLEKWSGILEATGEMPHCLQATTDHGTDGQEDCLYLNIFRPKTVPMSTKLPVLFHVHGGAFQNGNSASPKYVADYLMGEDVVLVMIHYRLNGFGFMSLGDAVLPGNFGLKDQAMALKWVNQNIESFGGDPNSVTVFGESAGGASAHYLLKSPLSQGFLTRAWSDSGSINHAWAMMKTEDATANTVLLANQFGCSTTSSEEIVECLRKIDARELMKGMNALTPHTMTLDYLFNPVIESAAAEDPFMIEDLALTPSDKPWVSSTTNGEYLLHLLMIDSLPDSYMDNIKENVTGYLYNWLTRHTTDPHDLSLGLYFLEGSYLIDGDWNKFKKDLSRAFAKLHGDNGFVYPAIYTMMVHQGPKWMYRFEYHGQGGITMNPKTGKPYPDKVAAHAVQTAYYFNWFGSDARPAADWEVTDRLVKYLTNFAIHGNPTPEGSSVHWDQFTTPTDFNIMPQSGMETLRITAKGDYLGDDEFRENLYGIYWTWNTTVAWR